MPKSRWPRLRRANNADCPKITDLVFNVLQEYNLKPDPESIDADIRDIERSYFERGGANLGANLFCSSGCHPSG
ncbi:MAG: hypothetical protein H8E73_03265, partial [Planctomycetes bacterium]|nr:hypothetical protein [Planctomycetota bacterium]